MDFLILAPPVTMPAEPPSGAFCLAAGLAGHGQDVALLDLSLAFFRRTLRGDPAVLRELRWLSEADGYTPQRHRTATGQLHRALKAFPKVHQGWRLSLMDLSAPSGTHDPASLAELLAGYSPFTDIWTTVLDPALERHRPREVLVSLAYLSQLPATLDLVAHLRSRGIEPIVGGSLPSSLKRTGQGYEALAAMFPRLRIDDGSSLLGDNAGPLLERLAWPRLLPVEPGAPETGFPPYLSSRPIIPLPLSTGCYWNKCLFCPDRDMAFRMLKEQSLGALFEQMPAQVGDARPVVHLLDSAIPPARLRRFLPLSKQFGLEFYGFARPSRHLLERGLMDEAADSGCLMLQLGVEGGDHALLDRYDKGFAPGEAEDVVRAAAERGIRTYVYLLFGLPGEDAAARQATLDMMVRLKGTVDFLNLSVFNLPLVSELTEKAAEYGLEVGDFGGDPLQLYRPFRCVDGSDPRREARQFLNEVFKPHAVVRPALLGTPRWLRAAHMALMRMPGRRWNGQLD